jgi:two-component system KDP operon response regulator KdpE
MVTQTQINPMLTSALDRATVLIVDDDEATVKLLAVTFERAGARVLTATSGLQALRQTFENRPDVVLLDLSMPEMDGITVCQRLRELSDVPVIMVTAFNDTGNVTSSFAAGVDDFVGKPFENSELLARVQACLRRVRNTGENEENLILGKGDLVIDLRRHNVLIRQRQMHLTRTEFDLLVYMARNRGRILPHAMLKAAIWGDEAAVGHDSLKQFIGALRKKIELDPRKPQWLISEHGVGYILLLD